MAMGVMRSLRAIGGPLRIRASAGAAAAFAMVGGAIAQEEPAELEEIVVTAQKREQLAQDVPISMAVVGGERIDELALGRIRDLAAYVPNLATSETSLNTNIAIRGIFSGPSQGFWQSVGTYVDGVYRGRSQQTRAPFLDLQRVEVLRGSQNILFGRNSIAGALNITTAQPTDSFEGQVGLLYEPELGERELTGVMSGPLGEGVHGRIALRAVSSDGYMRDLTLGRDVPKRDDSTLRATLAFEPSDRLDIRLKAETSTFDVLGRNSEVIEDKTAVAGPFAGSNYSQILVSLGQDPSVLNTTLDYARSSNGDVSNNGLDESVLTVDYSLGDLTLTSVTAYSSYEYDEVCDCDFTGGKVFTVLQNEAFDQLSQEVRVASSEGRNLDFIFGIYYQRSDLDFFDTLVVTDESILVPIVNAITQSTNGQFLASTATPRYFHLDTSSVSVFGQADWRLGSRARLTAGLRLSDERSSASRELSITGIDYAPLAPPAATVAPLLYAGLFNVRGHEVSGHRSDTLTMPSLGLQYDFGADSMGYVTIARGAKSGGFDPRSNNPVDLGGAFEFEDEKATNLEAGAKLRLPERNAEIDIALFHTKIEDMQVSVYDGVLGYNVKNAGEAVTQGLEVEARWAVTRRLTLSGSLALTDFEFKDYLGQCYFAQPADAPDGINCNYAGKTNQYVPDSSAVLGLRYVVPMKGGLSLRTLVDVLYSDEYFRTPTLDPEQVQPSYTMLNARLAFGNAARGWEVALVGRNLTAVTVVRYSVSIALAGPVFGTPGVWGFVDPQRTVAVQGTLRF